MSTASKRVGKTRKRLALKLEAAFLAIGEVAMVEAEALRSAAGYWRTDYRADTYRWEGQCRVRLSDGSWMAFGLDSWDTMTDCVRSGVTVERDRASYLASANESRVHPVVARAVIAKGEPKP